MIDGLRIADAFSTWFMVGVIWLVQLVVYPSFHDIDPGRFCAAMSRHQKWMARIVILPMFVESATSLMLLARQPDSLIDRCGCLCVVTWWFSTVLIQIPMHKALLTGGPNEPLLKRLVDWNWPRTVAWTVHGVLCVIALAP